MAKTEKRDIESFIDMNGNAIRVGDWIVYPTVSRSAITMHRARVMRVFENKVESTKKWEPRIVIREEAKWRDPPWSEHTKQKYENLVKVEYRPRAAEIEITQETFDYLKTLPKSPDIVYPEDDNL